MHSEDEATVLQMARLNEGRHLIAMSTWRNETNPVRKACERLVNAGLARWLPCGDGQPGPGIQLTDRGYVAILPSPTSAKVAMPLSKALHILAATHTRDDDEIGFIVLGGAGPHHPGATCSMHDYMRAWESVRAHLHMQTEPKP